MSCKHCNSGPFRSNIENLTKETNMKDFFKKIKPNHIGNLMLSIAFLLAVTIPLTFLYWLFFYEPKVDYCYLDYSGYRYDMVLLGHKKYGWDTNYGIVSKSGELNKETIENAKVISKELGCEFKLE